MQSSRKALKRAVFIFRRDMRLDDNTGLIYALAQSDVVYPLFVLDKKQITPSRNPCFGHNCVQFMCEGLEDLDEQIRRKGGAGLTVLTGEYPGILKDVIALVKPSLLCLNMDYTPYSRDRDTAIKEVCEQTGVEFKSFEDICLVNKDHTVSGYNGDVFYKKFTPYYNSVVHHKIPVPVECTAINFAKEKIGLKGAVVSDFGKSLYEMNDHLIVRGGRTQALEAIGKIHLMKNYQVVRDQPMNKTSLLSAYNKFGCLSIREVYHTSKTVLKDKAEPFLRQLYWRDFYYYIGYFFPHVFTGPMKPSYSQIPWEDNPDKIRAWQEGRCGCPIVDAAMRQLNKVGWMPNRCRMIVSNYLIKDLHVNWQIGERYFATQLVDFDPCQNNGGWQWSSGSGVDSQPYFRVFNPVLQMQKFDPKAEYVKQWIPELRSIPAEAIHDWESKHGEYKDCKYPAPLVTHCQAKQRLVLMYKASFDATTLVSEESDSNDTKPAPTRKGQSVEPGKKTLTTGKNKSSSGSVDKAKGKKTEQANKEVSGAYGVRGVTPVRTGGENNVLILLGKRVKTNPSQTEVPLKKKK